MFLKRLYQILLSDRKSLFPLIIILILIHSPNLKTPDSSGELDEMDNSFLDELNECTTGIACGQVTPDGCPLLWKNRDVLISDQEFHYVGFPEKVRCLDFSRLDTLVRLLSSILTDTMRQNGVIVILESL